MKHVELSGQDRLGFTDLFIVTHADFVSEEVGVGESLVLETLAKGDFVLNDALLEIVTPAEGLDVALGLVAETNGGSVVDSSDLSSAGDPYYASPATAVPFAAPDASDLYMQITPGETEAVGAISAGEFWIWVNINRKTRRNVQV